MAMFVRSKRVTDPLNDRVKACICGKEDHSGNHVHYSSSSGSEHDGGLSNLIHGFFVESDDGCCDSVLQEGDDGDSSDSCCNDRYRSSSEAQAQVKESIKTLLNHNYPLIHSHVSMAMKMFDFFKSDKAIFQRRIMLFLRELGYNAGICKTKWESHGALTAGNYEFIDVVMTTTNSTQERYFIDVDFVGEFQVARPTAGYESLLKVLPRVYIGRSDELKDIIKLMCDAAKRSLKSRDLHLPPWRKNRYMQLKWFGPYRRTTNPVSSNLSVSSRFDSFGVKCRSIGFDAVGKGSGQFNFPVATRTRA